MTNSTTSTINSTTMNVTPWLEATFCSGGDHLWSAADLWNTPVPVFSRCLLKTVPVWAPALVLTLCAPLQTVLLWRWHRSHRGAAYPIALNAYNVGRMAVVGMLITLSLLHLGYDYIVALDYDHHPNSSSHHNLTADLSSSLINAFVFSLLLFLLNLHRLTGQHTSALAWYFTALLLLTALPTVYMLSMYFWHRDTFHQQFNNGPAEAVILLGDVVLKVLLFLLTCFADRARLLQDVDEEEEEGLGEPLLEPYPESGVSFLSKHTYWWFNPLVRLGFAKSLKAEDVWDNQPKFKARNLAARFERQWRLKADKLRARGRPGQPGVLSVLVSTFGPSYLRSNFFQVVSLVLIFTAPQLLKQTIAFISEVDAPAWHGYLLATALFSTYAVNSLVFVYFIRRICAVGNAVKNSLVTAIYRKALRLSSAARRQATTGQIVNLMSTDARQFHSMIMSLDDAWVAPTQICLSTFFLWSELGPSALAGIGAMVALLPLNWWFTRIEQRAVKRQKAIMDERVNLTSETLAGIRVIKLYGWENAFIEKIGAIRMKEIAQLRIISLFNAITSFTWNLAPFLVAFSTFGVYVLSSPEHVLDAKKAFLCLTLFTMLQYPLGALPQVINKMVETATSVQRLNRYFAAEELENYIQEEEEEKNEDEEEVDIRMEKATLSWGEAEAAVFADDEEEEKDKKKKRKEKKKKGRGISGSSEDEDEESSVASSSSSAQPPLNLTSIDLRIRRGSLVAIVGRVGAGKSSLLSAILGEMQLTSGRVKVAAQRSISYVAQQAWIQNATLRDNILFGGRYEEQRYKAVLKMCALGPDLAILPGGDQTEIGEKGINLSGGQKQRVALARACYAPGADIFLFDDPLSAVDSHVARHLFTHVLSSETGFLKDRTRVLATNNVSILSEVDQIIVLVKGAVSEVGTYAELMGAEGGAFAAFMREHAKQQTEEEVDEDIEEGGDEEKDDKKKKKAKKAKMDRQKSETSQKSTGGGEKDVLIEEEKAEEGDVKMSVYLNYFRSLRVTWLLVIGLSWLAMQVAYVGTDLWLAIWSSDAAAAKVNSTENSNSTSNSTSLRNERLAVYGALGFSHNLLFFAGWIALALGSAASSVTLHRNLLQRIMRSPMAFFDTTPLGRIINRFSKDLATIDSNIRFALEGWVICLLQVFSLIIMIIVQIPVLAVVVFIVAILYYLIQRYYIATYRQLSRLESVTSSPIFSHFAESLSGMATIRAFAHQRRFMRTSNRAIDLNQRVWWAMIMANRWMSVRMELCGNLIVLFAALLGVAYRDSFAGRPGYFGLIISYAMSITGSLKWLVRNSCEMETSIVSVERIGEYSELPMEAEWTRPPGALPRLPTDWPTEGAIRLEHLSIRYREGLEPVLKDISLEIRAGEKVGVIGRTGAGKSTITLALFRILETGSSTSGDGGFDGGRITIDGVDISQIGLHELRSRLAIIPQDPVLFSGTIRSNLDPLGTSASADNTDATLWTALERCHLKETVASMAGGLDAAVAEGGSNLSQGERQLLCLGRALLRRAKILVLDEATAAVDLATDALVQETIRREFAHCTVLTIAHRLHTVLNYDRILALAEGRVVEFDSPQALLADPSSLFHSLAKDAGLL